MPRNGPRTPQRNLKKRVAIAGMLPVRPMWVAPPMAAAFAVTADPAVATPEKETAQVFPPFSSAPDRTQTSPFFSSDCVRTSPFFPRRGSHSSPRGVRGWRKWRGDERTQLPGYLQNPLSRFLEGGRGKLLAKKFPPLISYSYIPHAQLMVVGFFSRMMIFCKKFTALARPSSMVMRLSSCSMESTRS